MQALMLAAGMGKRLGKYTKNNTKCMLDVDGKTLIERATEALLDAGITKFIMVVGYKKENVKKFILEECTNPRMKEMEFVFIDNEVFDKTNNIYSLYMAKDYLEKDDTILLESDLIYDPVLIKRLVDSKKPNLVSVAKYDQWMDGTVIKIDKHNNIIEFIEKKNFEYEEVDKYYKTVNVYKFSKEFSKNEFNPFLEAYIKSYGENEYYELVLKIIAHLSRSQLEALDVSDIDWYEIDDAQDLDIATCMFSKGKERLKNFQKRYGGYWRFNGILDYCYLVNPYYPPKKMLDKVNFFSKELVTQYPSGMSTQCINASRLFGDVDETYFCVGNGAAELINTLGRILKGKMLVTKTAFHEYIRCFENCDLNILDMSEDDYRFNIEKIKKGILDNDIICIVNPDNPTGAYLKYDEIIPIIEECNRNNKIIIVDESFIDFANKDERYTLINEEILKKYKNLIVIKSISKSYGIPGFRLGVLVTSNENIMKDVKKYISIWNINSYGEYFLQIANLYKKDYAIACDKIADERNRFVGELRKIQDIKVYDSAANYVLCDLGEYDSTLLAEKLIDENIFIKDLQTKDAFKGLNYVRLAVRTKEENDRLVTSMKDMLKKM